jgi:hypothetical protein
MLVTIVWPLLSTQHDKQIIYIVKQKENVLPVLNSMITSVQVSAPSKVRENN